MKNILDKYLFQVLDAYPYDLQEAVESLNYALSYDDKNPVALCLLGRIHADTLSDYETAKNYFQQALAENIYALEVYPHYINVLFWNEDYNEAEKLIDFALTVKGSDKGMLHLKKGLLFEHKKEYKNALKMLKKAKVYAWNNNFINDLKEEEKRIKEKMPKKKKTKVINNKPPPEKPKKKRK